MDLEYVDLSRIVIRGFAAICSNQILEFYQLRSFLSGLAGTSYEPEVSNKCALSLLDVRGSISEWHIG